jgi:ATP-dependent metalloprotease
VLGSAKAPIHMITADGGWRRQAWATVRTLGTAFLVLSALGAMVEDNKIGKSEHRARRQAGAAAATS